MGATTISDSLRILINEKWIDEPGIAEPINEVGKENEVMRVLLTGLILFLHVLSGQTLSDYIVQGKEEIKSAYSLWDQQKMLEARAYFERVLAMGEQEWLLNYYIAYCDYRLSTYAVSENDEKAARDYINDGIDRLERSTEENPEFGEAFALMSSFYGYKISLSPWTGFIYGPRAGRLMETALSITPSNPRIHLIQGTSQYYTSPAFGGGIELAKVSFEKAIELFAEEEADYLMPDWGHSEAFAWLGLAELDLGDTTSAESSFLKALEIDPENNWVRYQLLPLLTEN